MTEAYNDALAEHAKQNVWNSLKAEAAGMSKLEQASVAADIAGLFDPTPASDAVGAVLSLIQGDLLGAGLSVVGMLPYAGDIAKIPKIAKHAPRTASAIKLVMKRSSDLANAGEAFLKNNFTLKQIEVARAKATERVRKALLDAKNKVPCKDCAKLKDGGKKQLQMPETNGTWKGGQQPADGNGIFTLDQPVKLPDGQMVSSMEYKDGFPLFDKYTLDGKHTLLTVTGNVKDDTKALLKQMRENNPNYKLPGKDYTLHHFEDGTVGFVPRDLHGRGNGFSHTGGQAIVNNELF